MVISDGPNDAPIMWSDDEQHTPLMRTGQHGADGGAPTPQLPATQLWKLPCTEHSGHPKAISAVNLTVV